MTHRTQGLHLMVAYASAALMACGGSTVETTETNTADTDETTVASGGETDPSVVPSPPRPWDELTMDEKKRWMTTEVMPRMSALFEEFDAERFGGFGCDGCHGDDARERSFAMPNESIMALHPTGSPEQQQMVRDNREMVVFMFQRVLPTMQTLLGEQAYDETTREGFSCFACHPRGGEQPTATLEMPAFTAM